MADRTRGNRTSRDAGTNDISTMREERDVEGLERGGSPREEMGAPGRRDLGRKGGARGMREEETE